MRLRSFEDVEDALRWVQAVPDEAERQIVTVRLVRRWRKQDEAAAEAWLAESGLPEELRVAARAGDVHAPIPVSR